jgi:hypothetical protein
MRAIGPHGPGERHGAYLRAAAPGRVRTVMQLVIPFCHAVTRDALAARRWAAARTLHIKGYKPVPLRGYEKSD